MPNFNSLREAKTAWRKSGGSEDSKASYTYTKDGKTVGAFGHLSPPSTPSTPSSTEEASLPESEAPESFNYSESLRNIATSASQLNQREHLDERFEALGLGSMKGSQISSGFMGKLVGEFKAAKDKGVLQVLGAAERKQAAIQAEKDRAQAISISMIDTLIKQGALSSLSGTVLRDYEQKAGYQPGYLSALKEAEIELEAAQKTQDDLAIRQAEANIDRLKADAERIRAETGVGAAGVAPTNIAPPNGKYDYDIVPSGAGAGRGITISVENGDHAGQCGRFVNDTVGIPSFFGNSYAEKFARRNSDEPVAGAAFIMDLGTTNGHCGMVEQVFADGSIAIVESNLYSKSNPETISRRILKKGSSEYNQITGYYIPEGVTEKSVILSQIRNGIMTPKEGSEFREIATKEGWLADLNKELNDPKNKVIGATTADRYNTDTTMTNRTFDELITTRNEEGYGNKTFQGLGKDIEGFEKFLELGRRLNDAKDLWKDFQDKGYSLRGSGSKFGRTTDRLTEIFGGGSEENLKLFREIQAITGESLANYVKEISGAAVAEEEFKRLKQNKPNVEQADDQFEDQLNRMIDDYMESMDLKVGKYGFRSEEELKNAVRNYGFMPTNLGEISKSVSIYETLGFDNENNSIYNATFSSGDNADDATEETDS